MSNDLINRKNAIESIWSIFNNTYNDTSRFEAGETELARKVLVDAQRIIEEQPTAYDVDKVVERLEEARCNQSEANELAKHGDYGTATMIQGIAKGYKYSADIVKSGGIE